MQEQHVLQAGPPTAAAAGIAEQQQEGAVRPGEEPGDLAATLAEVEARLAAGARPAEVAPLMKAALAANKRELEQRRKDAVLNSYRRDRVRFTPCCPLTWKVHKQQHTIVQRMHPVPFRGCIICMHYPTGATRLVIRVNLLAVGPDTDICHDALLQAKHRSEHRKLRKVSLLAALL
jgi:hypothetical protein